VAWWPFDELSGFSADIAGANHGNLINNPNPVPGKVDEALDFDGQDQFVEVADDSSLNFGTDESFSIDLWIKPTKLENLLSPLVEKWDAITGTGYRLFMRSGTLVFTMNDGSSATFSYVSPNKIVRGVWTLIAITVDRVSGEGRVYVNGGPPEGAFVPTSGNISNQQPLFIGRSVLGGFYHGVIDEVEIYNRPLSDTEVNAIYIADREGKCKS
jgi:hypothetical protein